MLRQKNYCVNYARRLVYAPSLPLLWSKLFPHPSSIIFQLLLLPHTSPLITKPLPLVPPPSSLPPPSPSSPLPHASSLLPISLHPSPILTTPSLTPPHSFIISCTYPLIPHPPPSLLIRVHHIRFFSNIKNPQSSYGSPEENLEPKIFYIFLATSLCCAGGQKV